MDEKANNGRVVSEVEMVKYDENGEPYTVIKRKIKVKKGKKGRGPAPVESGPSLEARERQASRPLPELPTRTSRHNSRETTDPLIHAEDGLFISPGQEAGRPLPELPTRTSRQHSREVSEPLIYPEDRPSVSSSRSGIQYLLVHRGIVPTTPSIEIIARKRREYQERERAKESLRSSIEPAVTPNDKPRDSRVARVILSGHKASVIQSGAPLTQFYHKRRRSSSESAKQRASSSMDQASRQPYRASEDDVTARQQRVSKDDVTAQQHRVSPWSQHMATRQQIQSDPAAAEGVESEVDMMAREDVVPGGRMGSIGGADQRSKPGSFQGQGVWDQEDTQDTPYEPLMPDYDEPPPTDVPEVTAYEVIRDGSRRSSPRSSLTRPDRQSPRGSVHSAATPPYSPVAAVTPQTTQRASVRSNSVRSNSARSNSVHSNSVRSHSVHSNNIHGNGAVAGQSKKNSRVSNSEPEWPEVPADLPPPEEWPQPDQVGLSQLTDFPDPEPEPEPESEDESSDGA